MSSRKRPLVQDPAARADDTDTAPPPSKRARLSVTDSPSLSSSSSSVFEAYLAHQHLVPREQWSAFIDSLATPLPVTFRINEAVRLEAGGLLDAALATGTKLMHAIGATPLPWCNGWQLPCDSLALKNASDPDHKAARRWLLANTRSGLVARQEKVSMVPVTVLQIEHHHRVLDMCAAPGSKTRQALDAMLTHAHAHAHAPRRIKGFVLANDCDPKRAYVLAHQSRALGVHTQRLLISCHKAQKLPLVAHDPELHGFDRIICDVPCSGDGTIRKAPEVWHRWHPDFGLELHRLQLQIAMRGVALLRLGGLMCYSTCSFNPIEDEAVVSEILARCAGSVELVDITDRVKTIDYLPGVTNWLVTTDDLQPLSYSPELLQTKTSTKKRHRDRRLSASMWPPHLTGRLKQPDVLTRCVRLFPHRGDGGGFFVALLRKIAPLAPSHRSASSSSPVSLTREIRPRQGQHGFVAASPPVLERAAEWFGLPRERLADNRLLKNGVLAARGTSSNSILLLSRELHHHVTASSTTNVVWGGVRLLELDRRSRQLRLTLEGATLLGPHVTRQLLLLPKVHVRLMLRQCSALAAAAAADATDATDAHNSSPCTLSLDRLPKLVRSRINSTIEPGAFVIAVEPEGGDDDDAGGDDHAHGGTKRLYIGAWLQQALDGKHQQVVLYGLSDDAMRSLYERLSSESSNSDSENE